MRPGLGGDVALELLLKPVVTNCGCRVEAVGDVRGRDVGDVAGRDGVVGPDPGGAVSLQLATSVAAFGSGAPLLHLVHRAKHVLDVMAVLVSDDIVLRERSTLRPELGP